MFDIYFFLLLFPVGFFVGQYLEWRHYQSIQKREEKFVSLVATSNKEPIGEFSSIRDIRLVQGSAVISVDYFKRILAALRGFFGGNVRSYETLLDRARREAILRLKESSFGAIEISRFSS